MMRWFGIGVVMLWLAAMSVLFYLDVWPHWIAGDPPVQMPDAKAGESLQHFQNAILGPRGRIGTSWVHFYTRRKSTLVHTQTVLYGLPLLPPILVDSELTYPEDGKLDTIKIIITGAPIRLEFNGENYGMDFSCELITGPGPDDRYGFKLDADAAATMSDALRPFTLLRGLHVGKTWRMRLINPLPALRGGRAKFESHLVRVTALEPIDHQGEKIECFRIESPHLKAWADVSGRVLVQQVDLPVFGRMILRQEPYDDEARLEAIEQHRGFGRTSRRTATTTRMSTE